MPTSRRDAVLQRMRDHLPTRAQARAALRRLRRRGPVVTSTAVVATDRSQRYGKQLVSHLGRKATGRWDEGSVRGTLEFGGDGDRAVLTSGPDALTMTITAQPHAVRTLEHVLGGHLVRFGARDGLVVRWTRGDGTPGTVQRADDAPPSGG